MKWINILLVSLCVVVTFATSGCAVIEIAGLICDAATTGNCLSRLANKE